MNHLPLLAVLSTGLLLAACQAQAPATASPASPAQPPQRGPMPHQVLHLGAQCGADSASVDRIADAAGLRQAIAGRTVGAAPAIPPADFDRSMVLRLSMGQQPNPGHRLGVLGARVDGTSGRLVVDTIWATPEPGRMYAAMVVQPCVIVSVPRGDYGSVVVLDTQGRERMGAPLR